MIDDVDGKIRAESEWNFEDNDDELRRISILPRPGGSREDRVQRYGGTSSGSLRPREGEELWRHLVTSGLPNGFSVSFSMLPVCLGRFTLPVLYPYPAPPISLLRTLCDNIKTFQFSSHLSPFLPHFPLTINVYAW